MNNPRTLILRAVLLDAAGPLLILGLILWIPSLLGWTIGGSSFAGQGAGAMNGLHWSMGLPCLQCYSCQTDEMVGIA